MKNIKLLLVVMFLLIALSFAQDMQYVSKKSGDSLWVKDDSEYGDHNSLYLLMRSDSLAPAGRVYVLKENGVYSLINNPVTSAKHRTIIMGESDESIKTRLGAAPPIISGAYTTGVNTSGGINVSKDLLIKNVDLEIGNASGNTSGWTFFNLTVADSRLQVNNCIMEHTWWCWVGGPPADSRIFFTNDYFVNLNGHSCRKIGGVTDFNRIDTPHQDTLVVENCTHVNTQGTLYRFRDGYAVSRVIFNHNNFIDCAGYVFMSYGNQANMSVTNNIFVNCQLQAFCPVRFYHDTGIVDPDGGLVNVRDDSVFQANGASFYADRNLTYWDPSLSDIVSTLNADSVNGSTEWVSQMITMNTRTAELFADDVNYPRLTNGTWYNQLPDFADTDNLFTTQLAVIKAYAIAAVDTGYGTPMPSWRQPNNPEETNFVHADWPIPIDLSYDDTDLLTAGLGGFPLGDLNWFPEEMPAWEAQKAAEYAYIASVLQTSGPGDNIQTTKEYPRTFRLQQNYPNPFNPSTIISYHLSATGEVALKVYDILGREVATLVNERQNTGMHRVHFDGSSLASGIYFYYLRVNGQESSKKMVLMR